MRVYLSVRGVGAIIPLPDGWPAAADLVVLAEALARTTLECPTCPEVPASAFLVALAREAPQDLAARLRDLACRRE